MRTTFSYADQMPAYTAFMIFNKWKKAVIITSTEEVYLQAGIGLEKQMVQAGINTFRPPAFEPAAFETATLSDIKRMHMRVVVLLAYAPDVRTIASSAAINGMGSGWAWLIPQLNLETWVDSWNVLGWLYLSPLLPSEGMQLFAEQVKDYTRSEFDISIPVDAVDLPHSAMLYDAIMLFAHAATAVLAEEGNLDNGLSLISKMRNTSFLGKSGRVEFDQNGDRIMPYEMMNYVLRGYVMKGVPVGNYTPHNSTSGHYIMHSNAEVMWPGSYFLALV